MPAEDYFSKTYQGARAKFLAACQELRVQPTEFRGPYGPAAPEPPLIECLRLGDPAATNLLVIYGGDRRSDALCCAGIETGWLKEFGKAKLPANTAIGLLHHGAVPKTGGEIPGKGGPPPQWEDDILAKVEERYAEYARLQGIDSTGAPLPESTDGDVPGYPARLLDMLAHAIAPGATSRIIFVEIRVGLGRWGEAELFPCHPRTSPETKRIRQWFSLAEPSEDAPPGEQEPGCLGAGLMRRFAGAEITAATASFGTYSMMSILESLATRPNGQVTPETGQVVFPQSAEWRDEVWRNAIVVIQRALTGMQHS